jgi:hypothetical protein
MVSVVPENAALAIADPAQFAASVNCPDVVETRMSLNVTALITNGPSAKVTITD